jgi:hypothetical protein
MLCLIPIGRGLMMGTLTVFAAAQRAAVLVAMIWLLQRFVVPLIVAMAFPETAAVAHAVSTPDATPEE